jgi:2-aminophenol/2-amino-5-chlorophenol 1,6-dioxygenase alpha subunit
MSGLARNTISKAYWMPGLPHLVSEIVSPVWQPIREACKKAGERVKAENPDVIVIYSAQWMSVLGHSFQTDPNPTGYHVDENWHDVVDFPFSFQVDVTLAKRAAEKAQSKGLATKEVNYQGFPVDTGTLVVMKYLNPDNKIPVMIVSSNVYCGREDSEKLGEAVQEALAEQGKKAVLVTCSALSHRFHTEELDPAQDKLARPEDDAWNQKMLTLIQSGKNKEAADLGPEYAQAVAPEMMFKGFYWMMGALGHPDTPAELLAYGPVWGTGAAVWEYSLN